MNSASSTDAHMRADEITAAEGTLISLTHKLTIESISKIAHKTNEWNEEFCLQKSDVHLTLLTYRWDVRSTSLMLSDRKRFPNFLHFFAINYE